MNADVFFAIGRTHEVCQDYATVYRGDRVALSDGCSQSQHTDFGARLLCRVATVWDDPVTAVKLTQPHLAPFHLPVECLDATLLTAGPSEDGKGVSVSVCGDGVVVGRKRGGGYTLILSEYPSGAPRYASYDLDPKRRARYLQEFGNVRGLETQANNVHRVTVMEGVEVVSATDIPIEDAEAVPLGWFFDAAEYDMVALLSDGAQSFHRPTGENGLTAPVPLEAVVREVLAVKGFAGQFITRRARRFLKEAAAKGWTHDDDFSVAAIYTGEVAS